METMLVCVAAAFAIFTGVNDGGALLATSLKITAFRPVTAAAVLTVAVIVAPAIVGTNVATTLAHRLVDFQGPDADVALLIAVSGACVVVVTLSIMALPTSLTLALVGGIAGVGVGGGMPVSWSWVLGVLALAAAAPFAGCFIALGVSRLWHRLPLQVTIGEQARVAHRIGLAMVAGAYAVNDGQKMLAVFALATPALLGVDLVDASLTTLVAIGGLFALGITLGFRRHGARMGSTIRVFSPADGVTAQLAAALAVTGSAVAGAPASMTQSLTGALVGSGLSGGAARVRWQHALSMVTAWLLTLPLSVGIVALPAVIMVRF